MAVSNRRILIIDDEPMVLSSLFSLLGGDYDVITAEEGISGLSLFILHRPSVVMVDVSLPFLNGVEILDKIRERDKDVPVIMMTGRPLSGIDYLWTERCAELGISGYLVKPVAPGNLLRQVKKILDGRGADRIADQD